MASLFRRSRIPLVAVAVPALLYGVTVAADRPEAAPDLVPYLGLAFMVAVTVSLIALIVWFFVGSGVGRRGRLAVGIGLLVLIAAGYASIRTFEFDGQMRPAPVFRWEPTAAARLAAYRATEPAAAGGVELVATATDSPSFRGPRGEGTTPGVTVGDSLAVKWRRPAGGGHGGLAVVGTGVVTIEQRDDDEAVVCYDRAIGVERWAYKYPAHFKTTEPLGGGGPRTTPAVADGDVVTFGALGDLACVDGRTGAKKWHTNAVTDSSAKPPEWAMSGSPLVVGDRVIVNPGVDPANNTKQAVAAYDRKSGKRVWAAGSHQAGYASPALLTLGGLAQVVVFDADGLGGYDSDTGAELWRHPWKSYMGMNSAQPVLVGPDRVFISSEKGNGGAVLTIAKSGDKWQVSQVWQSRAMFARYCSPVVVGGHIYGLSDGRLVCVDAATGKRVWAEGSYGNGQLLAAGDRLVVSAEDGDAAIVAADPAEHRELFRLDLFGARTWNMPALAGGEFFVRNHREVACLTMK